MGFIWLEGSQAKVESDLCNLVVVVRYGSSRRANMAQMLAMVLFV